MIRHRPIVAVLLLLAFAGPGLVGAADIRGYVVDPADDRRVGDVEVAFSIPGQDGAFTEMMRKSTDEEGRFTFSGPFLTEGLTYTLTAHYRGIAYPSSPLVLGQQRQVILEVFEPSREPEGVHLTAHHLFIVVGAELLEVAQLLQLHNTGDATFVGAPGDDGSLVTELRLPAGAANFRAAGQQGEPGAFVREGGSFYNTDPVLPGHSQFAFTFEIDLARFAGTYEHVAPYDTEKLELYVQPASLEISSPRFTDLGPVTLHDQTYRRYQLDNLPQGQTIAIPLPLSRPLRWTLKWVALGLTLFAAAAALGVARRGNGTSREDARILAAAAGVDTEAPVDELELRRQGLLERLASLSRSPRHEGDEEARRQLIDQTVALYRLLSLRKAPA